MGNNYNRGYTAARQQNTENGKIHSKEEQKTIAIKKAEETKKVMALGAESDKLKAIYQKGKEMKNERKIEVHSTKNKSRAKAAAVKSIFALEDKTVLLTTFGNGNTPIREKEVLKNNVKNLNNPAAFSLKQESKKYEVTGRAGIVAQPDSPIFSSSRVGQDIIDCKDELEVRYFGKTYNDNIHIQLIYSILDIEKILAVHANNIVYSLDNLRRKEINETDDFIGYMSTINNYLTFCYPEKFLKDSHVIQNIQNNKKIFDEYIRNPRLYYFGDTFAEKSGKTLKPEEDIYWIFALLGGLRQFCAHDKNKARHWLYNLNQTEMLPEAGQKYLAKNYNDALSSLDNSFVKNNAASNFTLLFNTFKAETMTEKTELACEYYDFTMRKAYKNMGFSIKVLREFLLCDRNFEQFKDDRYSTVRNKLYQIFNFVLYKYYKDNDIRVQKFVEKLRASLTDEEKENAYKEEAKMVAPIILQKMNIVKPYLTKICSAQIKELKLNEATVAQINTALAKHYIKTQKVSEFTQLIYLVTQVIDGKEINDLLTSLIHQFENIAGFIQVMNEAGIPCDFNENFKFFKNSGRIAEEIRLINSFARMTKINANAKKAMFMEAATVLGTDWTDAEINYELSLGKTKDKKAHSFRNFIINNVIESRKFHYLVRYANVNRLRKLADNTDIVKFVLKTIPETQLTRYCLLCGIEADNSVDALAKEIANLRFDDFKDVKQWENVNSSVDKAVKQAKVGLYLTVLYLLTKNLVNINSRYFIAFHCLERDSQLKGAEYSSGYKGENYCNMAKKYADAKLQREETKYNDSKKQYSNKKRYYEAVRVYNYICKNIENSDDCARFRFRNNIAHLNVVRNAADYIGNIKSFDSYYQLYHYLMQADIASCYNERLKTKHHNAPANETTLKYFDDIAKYKSYSKDFVKALCAPFSYNLPRFKNLSIDGLFDMNDERTDISTGMED